MVVVRLGKSRPFLISQKTLSLAGPLARVLESLTWTPFSFLAPVHFSLFPTPYWNVRNRTTRISLRIQFVHVVETYEPLSGQHVPVNEGTDYCQPAVWI